MPSPRNRRNDFLRVTQARELGISPASPSLTPMLGRFRTSPEEEYGFWSVSRAGTPVAVPPFTARFSTTLLDGHALLTGDEEGIITILDTNRSLRNQMWAPCPSQAPRARFRAHDNAVFDAIWLSNDTRVASASGDATVRVFDPDTLVRTALCRGASGSVKCVREIPSASASLLASCGRDGSIRVHDTRVETVYDAAICPDAFHKPVLTLERAHAPKLAVQASATKRRRIFASQSCVSASVTSMVMLPGRENLLYSGGAADGSIKLWDLRSGQRKQNGKWDFDFVECVTPSTEQRCNDLFESRRQHGIASLDMDASGTRLLASTTDSTIYLYDAHELRLGHLRSLRGHTATSFYIRSSFSPCGRFVASGSADSKAYLWDVEQDADIENGNLPILQLDGHRGGDVSVVEWCKADMFKLATCGDDATTRVWKVGFGNHEPGTRTHGNGDEACGLARAVETSGLNRKKKEMKQGSGSNTALTGRRAGSSSRRFRDSDIRKFFGNSSAGNAETCDSNSNSADDADDSSS